MLRVAADRLDEQLEGVMWVISHAPDKCDSIPGTSLYIIKTDAFPGAPALRVFFTIDDDDNACALRYVERISDSTD